MAYMDNIAPKRENPDADRIAPAEATASGSNQALSVGQSSKFRTVSTASALNVGNQVRVQANNKGTGVAGRPSSIALAGKDFTAPETANPDGVANAPGTKGTAN